jgi:hypothetical protein
VEKSLGDLATSEKPYTKMNVLLVEPRYKREYVPLSLMKFSALHKNKGDNVRYVRGINNFLHYEPELIYVTSVFTWDYAEVRKTINFYAIKYPKARVLAGGVCASLLKSKLEQETRAEVHFGVFEEVESIVPDYSLFPKVDYSISFTSRGCIRKCAWCPVNQIEPELIEIKDWFKQVNLSKKNIIFFDNNFTACSKEHQRNVLETCRKINKPIDFNQAFDCRLFDEEFCILLSKTKVFPLRFAIDTISNTEACVKAIKLANEYDIKKVTVDMLYNFTDKLEHFYERVASLIKLDNEIKIAIDVFPMKFQPLNALEKSLFIGKNFDENILKNIRTLLSSVFTNGIIGNSVPLEKFGEAMGNSPEEFTSLITMDYKKFKERCEEVKKKWYKGKLVKVKQQQRLV